MLYRDRYPRYIAVCDCYYCYYYQTLWAHQLEGCVHKHDIREQKFLNYNIVRFPI